MIVGFFHDSLMSRDGGKYYSRTLNAEIWKRYLSVFDQMVISTRVTDAPHAEMSLSGAAGVTFKPIESYNNPIDFFLHFKSIVKEINASLDTVECVVIRLPSVIGWVASDLARSKNIPVLYEVVGCPWDAYRFHSTIGKILAPIGYLLTRRALRRSDFATYVTQEFLQRRYPTSGKSIGVSDVNVMAAEQKLRDRLETVSKRDALGGIQTPVIGSIGRVDLKYKGHVSAIRALKLLTDKGIDARYEIVGPGDNSKLKAITIELGLQNKVTFLGPLSRSEVDLWLDGIDLYVQPSLTEGLPRSVVEAMSHALPVVLSDVGGHPELVGKEFLFSAGDEQQLADRIIRLQTEGWRSAILENFEKSKEYENQVLEERRRVFFSEFRAAIEDPSQLNRKSELK